MIILPADYLSQKFVEPLKKRQQKIGEARGQAQGHAQGIAEMLDWLRSKEEAEREGREFNDPMPGGERNGSEPKE